MSKRTYFEKLKDPRWQKKRLEVLDDSGWCCDICDNEKETLHVHHKIYIKGREPWEYDVQQLSCLCATCHQAITNNGDPLDAAASRVHFSGAFGRAPSAALLAGFSGVDYGEFLEIVGLSDTAAMRACHRLGRESSDSVFFVTKDEEGK